MAAARCGIPTGRPGRDPAGLGRMPPPERAVGLLAGGGMRIRTVFQEPRPLRAVQGRAAGAFLSSAGTVQAFPVSDLETARQIPSMPGAEMECREAGPGGTGPGAPGRG